MTYLPPGTYVTVSTAASPFADNVPTGTWFVTGETQQGPVGVAVPVTSMQDYANFLGARVSYGMLYDSLDEFFHDGGILAYVSRVVGPGALAAAITLQDTAGSPMDTLTVTAAGPGTWGNSLQVVVAAGTASNSYTIQILNNGTSVAVSQNLFTPTDAVNWFAAQHAWVCCVTVTNDASTSTAPQNNPATGTFNLTGGTDDTSDVTETQWTNALTAFVANLGPGQVSAPGHTTTAGYEALIAHASTFNRVALCDVADSSNPSTLVSQAQSIQSAEGANSSYGALLAPWVIIPGLNYTNPSAQSPVPTRVVPPSAVAAALMAANDANPLNTANVPAAGNNGQSTFAIGVTQTYTQSQLGTLNAGGVDVFLVPSGATAVTLYGYQSLSTDPNWVQLNNVRFRMQMINDFGAIGDNYVFAQIDGKGHVIAQFNGDLASKCQSYWSQGSLYGATAAQAFSVNTGSAVNTPQSIQAGYLKAQVSVVMSPFAGWVDITVVKYLLSAGIPGQS